MCTLYMYMYNHMYHFMASRNTIVVALIDHVQVSKWLFNEALWRVIMCVFTIPYSGIFFANFTVCVKFGSHLIFD